ncbi:CapA family protein [Actinomadura scrupuli]|uniref:CapA family protein n=1 Tax=Actinomadura scrupuli TaxID=559629 RepID=UPI003D967D2D
MRRRNTALVSALVSAALLATACGGGGTPAANGDTGTSGAPSSPQSKGGKKPADGGPKQAYTIAFGGDTHFEGSLRSLLAANPATAMGPIARTLKSADFAMVNLETAITTGGVPAPAKEFHFRAPATAFTALKASGVDVVTMANNHGMDFMKPGLRDSLAAIKKTRFPTVGIGRDADQAYQAYRTTVKGNRLAIVGATQVLDDHLIQPWTATDSQGGLASAKVVSRMLQAVRDARQGSDTVIVYLHWGQEMSTCPLPRQQVLAKQLVDAGADIVVGGHAHVLLGGGYLKGKYVHYGLGNFHFSSASGKTAESGVLQLTVRGHQVTRAQWKPARISGGLPRLLSGPAATSAVKSWNGLRRCTGLTATP